MENMEETAKKFLADYKKLVDKYGLQLAATPVWMQRDDNSFSTVIDMRLIPVKPKKE